MDGRPSTDEATSAGCELQGFDAGVWLSFVASRVGRRDLINRHTDARSTEPVALPLGARASKQALRSASAAGPRSRRLRSRLRRRRRDGVDDRADPRPAFTPVRSSADEPTSPTRVAMAVVARGRACGSSRPRRSSRDAWLLRAGATARSRRSTQASLSGASTQARVHTTSMRGFCSAHACGTRATRAAQRRNSSRCRSEDFGIDRSRRRQTAIVGMDCARRSCQ